MANLLFEKMPEISITTGNESRDTALNEQLKEIFKSNDALALLQNSAQMESYSGAVAFKFVLDPTFSDYPILIPYAKEDIEISKKYSQCTSGSRCHLQIFPCLFCQHNSFAVKV